MTCKRGNAFLVLWPLIAIASAFDGSAQPAATSSSREATALQASAGNWTSYGRTADEQRFSPLSQINTDTVSRLGLIWSLDLDGMTTLEATPLAIDGKLYFTGSHSEVFAVDARTGTLLWKFDPEVAATMPEGMRTIFAVNRGVAFKGGRVFVGTIDGRLIALDSSTGKRIWSVQTLPKDTSGSITGAPRVVGNNVVIGQGGAELGTRGFLTAYDAKTGRKVWRFYVVPGDPKRGFENPAMRMAASTWSGEWWKYGGGGTPWNAIAFDAELSRIYVGTGNSSPYDVSVRTESKGDNLFLASIVALDADTGRYIWHYQVNPQEAWDYKATMDIVLADLTIDGRNRKVLMQAPSNGFFYVIDRMTGKLVSAEKIGKVSWAERIDLATGRPVEAPGIRYAEGPITMWPGALGAHNWQAMSYNPVTGLVYLPYMQAPTTYARVADAARKLAENKLRYKYTLGVSMDVEKKSAGDGTGALLAWDPAANKLRWKVDYPYLWNGGTMTSAGNLVFQGTATGILVAYSADRGALLWNFDAKLGIVAPPITYEVEGHQYISILVGWGGSTVSRALMPLGWKYGIQPRRLLTFALDGKATLPPTAPPDFEAHAVYDLNFTPDPLLVERGATVFWTHQCIQCHGANLDAAGVAPDLRESRIVLDHQTFKTLLTEGLLARKGMPKFGELTDEDVGALQHYISARARLVDGAVGVPTMTINK